MLTLISFTETKSFVKNVNADSICDYIASIAGDTPTVDVTFLLQDLYVLFAGYGHWRITAKVELNGGKYTYTHTTTNADLYECWKDIDTVSNSEEERQEMEDNRQACFDEFIRHNLHDIERDIQNLIDESAEQD